VSIRQSPLPYELNALEPHISAQTMSYHYGRHHHGYVKKLNELIEDTRFADMDLETIVAEARIEANVPVLNNALQTWNHAFLWESMSPSGENKPEGRILERIEEDFGSFEAFREEFRKKALGHFGSGWVWLVDDGFKLKVITTADAESPVATGMTPLLVLDLWEHAYYLDYQNERVRYVDTFLCNLINWKFAAANLVTRERAKAA
jgi:Fe-Mn family superoxide dismutase